MVLARRWGLIELHLYSAPVALNESIGTATSMSELIAAVDAEAVRVRELAADCWEMFRHPDTGFRLLVDTRRPDEDLTEADLPGPASPQRPLPGSSGRGRLSFQRATAAALAVDGRVPSM